MKAKNNRTLTLSEEEKVSLFQDITSVVDLRSDSCDDKIICGDMTECMASIPDAYYDLIILDPPYNLSRDFHGTRFHACCDEDYEAYLSSWFNTVCNKLSPKGTLYMCGDWHSSLVMQRVIGRRLTILNRITWQREKGRGALRNWKNSMEDIWFAVNNAKDYYFNVEAVKMKRRVLAPYTDDGKPKDWQYTDNGKFRMTYPSNFWDDISVPFWSMPENTEHPTQKPEKLFAKLILASSRPGDHILDPFAGSGTTAVVAKKLGRHFTTIEENPTYCLWTAKRLRQAEEDPSIQGYTDGVFWERNSSNITGKARRKNTTEKGE